jgi:hypothetical protein
MCGVMYGQIIGDIEMHNFFMWMLLPLLFIAIYLGLPHRRQRRLWQFVRRAPTLLLLHLLRFFRINKK